MALSPWPTNPAALTAATAKLRAAIRLDGVPDSDARTQRVGAVAAALVEREAAGAPQVVKDEAVIRFAGYLKDRFSDGVKSHTLGPQSMEYVVNHAPMFRDCGAKGLLSPWKVRRAGLVG